MLDASIKPTPRRQILNDPANPLSEWLSGRLTVNHEDGRLRRAATLEKLAWCIALLGYDRDTIAKVVAERDSQPEYQRFVTYRHVEQVYLRFADKALASHDRYDARQRKKEAAAT